MPTSIELYQQSNNFPSLVGHCSKSIAKLDKLSHSMHDWNDNVTLINFPMDLSVFKGKNHNMQNVNNNWNDTYFMYTLVSYTFQDWDPNEIQPPRHRTKHTYLPIRL